MSKLKKKYEWISNGREPCAFGGKHPRELFGVHAGMIERALDASEHIECCLYAPRVSSTTTPFGLSSPESSCGLCVTDKRIILSRNRHSEGIRPTLTCIEFKDILCLHIGKALLLGWFSVRYREKDETTEENILFTSIGRHHFEKAVRSCKKYWKPIEPDGYESFSPAAFIPKITNKGHVEYIRKLMAVGERCLFTLDCRYVWETSGGRRSIFRGKEARRYASTCATCLLTGKSFLLAYDSLGPGIDTGTDVLVIPLAKIGRIDFLEKGDNAGQVYELRFCFKASGQKNNHLGILVSSGSRIPIHKKVTDAFFPQIIQINLKKEGP